MAQRSKKMISVVVPIYKEEGNITPFLTRMRKVLAATGLRYEILFCMDPSPDRTEEVVRAAIAKDSHIRLMVFARRFGQPAATLAGLNVAQGDAVVVIDVDLQDPPELIIEMVKRWQAGAEVVYAKRSSRRGETLVKKAVSAFGYKLINAASDVAIPRDTGDFRLLSRRVVDALKGLREKHGFLRGLVAYVGYRQEAVEFERPERHSGQGNYNRYLGSLRIGFNGLVGFSNFLLNATMVLGLAVAALSFLGALFVVVTRFFMGINYAVGIPTLHILVLFMGGAQLVSVGILGQYIGRIYDEVKDRPRYLVDRAFNMPALQKKPNRKAR
jgi:glycosyltransferase involved in cell wall biosynthesis